MEKSGLENGQNLHSRMEKNKVYVGNIHNKVTYNDFKNFFSNIVPITRAVIINKNHGRRFGFLTSRKRNFSFLKNRNGNDVEK